MSIIYTETLKNIDEAINLYLDAGWGTLNDYKENTIKYTQAFENSHAICAYKNETLIGFLRYFTDFNSTTYIIELIVSNTHRRQDIASQMLQKLESSTDGTTIYTESTKAFSNFYSKHGFKKHQLLGLSKKL